MPGPESGVRPGVPGPSSVQATLIVARTLASDVGQRQVYVDLDGQSLGHLLVGESLTRDIAAGSHSLKLNNTLVWKTLKFDAAPGEVVEFRFANKAGRFGLPFLALMGVAPLYLLVERVTPEDRR